MVSAIPLVYRFSLDAVASETTRATVLIFLVTGDAIREKYACQWFDGSHQTDPSGDCMIIDDQFALIPPQLAPFCEYAVSDVGLSCPKMSLTLSPSRTDFGTAEGNNTHFSLPHTHLSCTKWAEGRLTCMLLRGGANLELLYLPARLYKWCPDRCGRSWNRARNCRNCRPGELLCSGEIGG